MMKIGSTMVFDGTRDHNYYKFKEEYPSFDIANTLCLTKASAELDDDKLVIKCEVFKERPNSKYSG